MNSSALPFGVYILARPDDWRVAQERGHWRTAALEDEGFIHAASHEQVAAVFARRFNDVSRVCLLKLDEASLVDFLRWDAHPKTGELFPHIYCAVPLASVERVIDWPP